MAQGNNSVAYNDDDLIVSVSGKDATSGFRYVVPAPKLPPGLDAATATATMSGWYREMISPAQNAATKARKGEYKVERDGKEIALPEREAVQHFVNGFKPSADRTLPTVANKRMDIVRDMVAKALASRGMATTEANVEANIEPWLAGPKGTGKNKEDAEAALRAFLAEPYTVTKRGSKTADGEPTGTTADW